MLSMLNNIFHHEMAIPAARDEEGGKNEKISNKQFN
jgi:hypothetical protein